MLPSENRLPFGPDHATFRDSVRRFAEREVIPHTARWEAQGCIDREFWNKAGEAGLLAPQVPEAYGGFGLDYSFAAIVNEEMWYAGLTATVSLHTDVAVDYLVEYASEELKHRWLPGTVTGETVMAIAMTEPGTGSDLKGIATRARRDGDDYVINGSKTYITNGQLADLVIVVCKTDDDPQGSGMSLILVEADRPGFERGRKLDKIGLHASDTSELFFNDVRVPVSNRIGEEGRGMACLMQQLPQERLAIAISGQAAAQRVFDETVTFVKERKAFGKTVWDFQNTQFVLADLKTKLQVGWAHLDWALAKHVRGELDAYEASAAKLWHTDTQWEIMDACLQLHGGAGYMNEYPVARFWRDARVQRIYGGTNEIMKLMVARSI